MLLDVQNVDFIGLNGALNLVGNFSFLAIMVVLIYIYNGKGDMLEYFHLLIHGLCFM